MNPDNYTSLPISQRLVAAGIVLETEKVWMHKAAVLYPAPSMSELWRELPEEYVYHEEGRDIHEHSRLILQKCHLYCQAGYPSDYYEFKMFDSTNPSDALADLLIWVKGEKE